MNMNVCFAFLSLSSARKTSQPAFTAFVSGEGTGVFLPPSSPCSHLCSLTSSVLSEFTAATAHSTSGSKEHDGHWAGGGKGIGLGLGHRISMDLTFQHLPKAVLVVWIHRQDWGDKARPSVSHSVPGVF